MKRVCFIFLIGLLISSCGNDYLDRTVFIPDDRDYNLPAYTEWGYNTFGAEYERDYFLVSNKIVPCKILYRDNHLQFTLFGIIRERKEMSLSFIFPFEIANRDYTNLVQLHGTRIDLSDSICTVKINQNGRDTILDIYEGELYFKRAQILSVDEQTNRVILSGFFDLRFLQNDFPTTISNGRFDLGITKDVFHPFN
jgi:hypothetical protein